jgi:hypothetical protein
MIPLSLWLAERHPPPDVPLMDIANEEHASPLISPEEAAAQGDVDFAQREEALLLAVSEAEAKLQQQLLLQMERERELERCLGEDLGRRLESEISKSVGALLEAIEESLVQALTPFLNEQTRLKAITELTEMVRHELQRSDLPVLEIRAPARFHEALRSAADGANTSMTLAPSEIVEVILTAERRRFEELSARWVDAIEGMT